MRHYIIILPTSSQFGNLSHSGTYITINIRLEPTKVTDLYPLRDDITVIYPYY